MTPEAWQGVKQVLADALDLPAEERAAFLDAACAGRAGLRSEVEELLAAHEAAEASTVLQPRLFGSAAPPPMEGRRFGSYRVVRLLGRGGMGAVYLAERADGQFEQQVALKLVRAGVAHGAEPFQRFLAERRILARLHHPNIARLLDGGMTDAEQPYLVMEYVAGQPITDYCVAHRLSVDARLRLFRQVCDAVTYAHHNLVVHRDLKPSNVLVTEVNGLPQVKLLDFGIAKLLEAKLLEDAAEEAPPHAPQAAPLTHTGLLVMTPEYAAPEQMRGQPVTTATDVYALGILLYELLVDQRPYSLQGLTPSEMEQVVCETEPVRPSAAATRSRGTTAARAVDAPDATIRLQRRLRGDLDQIVLKALRKEPERRYATAEALSADLRRHLDGLPVEARPDTFGYRAVKFVRRNRMGVAALLLVVLALAGGLAAALWQARRVAVERDYARTEAAKAEAVNDFLQTVLSASDPYVQGQEVTVAQALEAAAGRVGRELARQPEVEAAVRRSIGLTYIELSRYAEARPHLEQALALHRRLYGEAHLDVAQSLKDLALLSHWEGDFPVAGSLYTQAIERYRRLPDLPASNLAVALNDYASLLLDIEADSAARAVLLEAQALFQSIPPQRQDEYAVVLNNLALATDNLGFQEAADSLYRQALALTRQVGDSLRVAHLLNNMAFIALRQKHMDDAEAYFRASLELRRQALGDQHPSVALALHNLSGLHRLMGHTRKAESFAREALAIWSATLPASHFFRLRGRLSLARTLALQDRYDAAATLLRRALAEVSADIPETNSERLDAVGLLGYALLGRGRYAEAETMLRTYVAGLEAVQASEADRQQAHGWLSMARQRTFQPTLR